MLFTLPSLFTSLLVATASVSAQHNYGNSGKSLPILKNGGGLEGVSVVASFPSNNPHGKVFNGYPSNLVHIKVANKADEDVMVTRVHGQFREAAGKQRPLKNTTVAMYQLAVQHGSTSPIIPYKFHSENKVGPVGLRVWVDYTDSANRVYTHLGYDGLVTALEPKRKWFDVELIGIYAILAVFSALATYLLYNAYVVPAAKKAAKAKKSTTPTVAPPAPASPSPAGNSATSYDEEWIPEQILRQRNAKAGSGAESDGGAQKKGKGKK